MCWIASATPAASPSMHWPVEQNLFSQWILPRMRWLWQENISSTSCLPIANLPRGGCLSSSAQIPRRSTFLRYDHSRPAQVRSHRGAGRKGARGYKDINLLAFKLLRPGGTLITFSCSGGVDAGLFQKIIAGAALDARVEAQIVEHLSQGAGSSCRIALPGRSVSQRIGLPA